MNYRKRDLPEECFPAKPERNRKRFQELERKCKEMGDGIQNSLETIFYDDDVFRKCFRRYAVF